MFIKILSLLFIIFGGLVFASPVHDPSWRPVTLDTVRAERFVTLALSKNSPVIAYFDAKSEGGVLYQRAKTSGLGFFDDLDLYVNWGKRDWETGSLDNAKFTGPFLSSVSDDKNIYVAYQDGTLGKEKLMYAVSTDGRNWQKEVVEDSLKGGSSIGMYTSIAKLNDQIVIFYHTEMGQKFGYARRISERPGLSDSNVKGRALNGDWELKTLEKGVGWLTASASCGDKVFVAYRGRDTDQVYLGILESQNAKVKSQNYNSKFKSSKLGFRISSPAYAAETDNLSWSSRKLPIRTSTSLALVAVKASQGDTSEVARRNSSDGEGIGERTCSPFLAYFDDKDSQVKFLDVATGTITTVDRGVNSRISLAANKNGFHLAYPSAGHMGMIYAKSADGVKWQTELISKDGKDGSYNSLATDEKGNLYLAILSGNSLKYLEYNVSSFASVKSFKQWSTAILLILGVSILLFQIFKKSLFLPVFKDRGKKNKI